MNLYTQQQAAKLLGVSQPAISQMIGSGRLKTVIVQVPTPKIPQSEIDRLKRVKKRR